jgi:phenylacetate-CoA ligase
MSGSSPYSPSTSQNASKVLDALRGTLDGARHSALYADRLRDVEVPDLDAFRKLPLTTRADLQNAGLSGTRAVPIEQICHYGETSGTTDGQSNSTWLTAEDLAGNARTIAARHPEIFAPGKILLNRFPFMAAPAHLIQLIAQQGGGVSIPAGNINWDVPFPRALELAERTGANVLAGFPLEPVILAQLARARGLDPAKDIALDTFFLGGAALPPVLQRRIERIWNGRVIELYGSTETMLLGTACADRTLHLEPDVVYCEFLQLHSDEPAAEGEAARLIVTTIGLKGSPLVRLETGDIVRKLPPCSCGDARTGIIVLGRDGDAVDLAGQTLYPYEIIEAAAAAADALDSSVFFNVVMPDHLLVRIEAEDEAAAHLPAAYEALRSHLGDLPVEVEITPTNTLLDVEHLGRSPSVYKPILVSDWTKPGRQLISVSQGMMEWPSLGLGEALRWLSRGVRGAIRRRRLQRELRVADKEGR